MYQELNYVKGIEIEEAKKVKLTTGKEFYTRKINIKTDNIILTMVLKAFTEEQLEFKPPENPIPEEPEDKK